MKEHGSLRTSFQLSESSDYHKINDKINLQHVPSGEKNLRYAYASNVDHMSVYFYSGRKQEDFCNKHMGVFRLQSLLFSVLAKCLEWGQRREEFANEKHEPAKSLKGTQTQTAGRAKQQEQEGITVCAR